MVKCQFGVVLRSLLIRVLFIAHALAMVGLAVIMHDGLTSFSRQWFIGLGVVFLIGETVFTFVQTKAWGWKWGSPFVGIYIGTVGACFYFMELRVGEYHTEGVSICTHYSLQAEFVNLKYLKDWLYFCKCGRCNAAMEQLFLICLLIGRWLLPHGRTEYVPRDQAFDRIMQHVFKSQLVMLIACNAADSLDFINYIREPDVKENGDMVAYIIYVWMASLVQFALVTTATKTEKSGEIILMETDMWSSLMLLLIHDLPYMAIRIYVMLSYQLLSSTGIFFLAKNIFFIFSVVFKTRMLCKVRDDERIQTLFASSQTVLLGERMEAQAIQQREEEEAILEGRELPQKIVPRGITPDGMAGMLPTKRPMSSGSWVEKRNAGQVVSLRNVRGIMVEQPRAERSAPVAVKQVAARKPRSPLRLRKGPRAFTEKFYERTEDIFEKETRLPVGTGLVVKTPLCDIPVKGMLKGMESDSSSSGSDEEE